MLVSNSKVSEVLPWLLVDVIRLMPGIVENCFSSGNATDDAVRSLVALSLLAEKGIQRFHGHSLSYEWEKGGERACQHLGLTEDETADLLDELHEAFHNER